ncbi:hypothetical protein CYMTET_32021 [Cymbomonas tetramitiformis]|uniref:mitogen-activated protein kinase kinase n=1 Tax=Cymbomonas tetramitiformis TaxID=36881 RepID=A0AAE0FGG5_9CHLO|nr:hypothetical protein CYMTET_32021 [Cymbomonas tetramitiformis]
MSGRRKPAPLFLPDQPKTPFSLTNSGTFTEGDLTINRNGLKVESKLETIPDASRPGTAMSHEGSTSPTREEGTSLSRQSSAEIGNEVGPSTSMDSSEFSILSLADLKNVGIVGKGSSGVVQKVQHIPTKDVYALKMIQMDMQEQVRKNILQELRTLHDAKCDNIVQCYGSFYENGVIYSVLEYMDGGSLTSVLKDVKTFSERHLAKISKQVLFGLSYLHKELHIIHRDIKPSNLLINRSGEVKISDFGVSGKLANSVADCASWVGTVTYMSPERISGGSYSFDSDIWSLGLSLVECAEGRFPYPPQDLSPGSQPSLSFWDLLVRSNYFPASLHVLGEDYIVERPPPEMPTDQYSAEFCSFISQCLQKDPKMRGTVSDLLKHPFIMKYDNEPDEIVAELMVPNPVN